MKDNVSFFVCLAFFFIGCIGVFFFRKKNIKNIPIFICLSSAILLPFFSHLSKKEKWESKSFAGFIVEKRVTEEHALIEFTIEDGIHGEIVVLDRLWEMKGFEIGDWVEKRKGERSVVGELE